MNSKIASENVSSISLKLDHTTFEIDELLMPNIVFHDSFFPFASIGHAVNSIVDTANTLPGELRMRFMFEVADRLVDYADHETNADPAPMRDGRQRMLADALLRKVGVIAETDTEAFELVSKLGYVWENTPGWWTKPEYAEANVEPVDPETARKAIAMFEAVAGKGA